ncbi:MAG TPA: AAA family ATPase [Pirellulales bacterium]|jgi:flagellar biosynthesis protein FlhG|nr:AAA family ATPase [Pirellulales bacterium]
MPDQANHLRQMIRGAKRAAGGGDAYRPRLLVVTGSKGGVGTTMLAVNVAVALSRQGRQTLLVDGDLGKADAAALCGTREAHTIGDVLAGRRRIQEALQPGPAGICVLPGAWATGHVTDCDAAAQERLIADLARLDQFDYVVIDAGCGVNQIVQRFWRAADRVLLVATPDSTSVLDAYAVLKTGGAGREGPPVQVVMNQADDANAGAALSRLREACRRFLGLQLDCTALLPHCREISAAARRPMPVVLSSPGCATARLIDRLAETIHRSTPARRANEKSPWGAGSSGAASRFVWTKDRQPGGDEIEESVQATHD